MQPGSDVYHSILVSRLLSNNLRKNVGTDLTQKRQANSRACKKQNKLYTKDKGFNRYLFHFWFQTRFNNIPYFCNKNWISRRHLGNFYSVLLLLPRTHVPTNSLRSKRQLNTISHRRKHNISTFVDQTHIQRTRPRRKTVFSKLVLQSC